MLYDKHHEATLPQANSKLLHREGLGNPLVYPYTLQPPVPYQR